MDFKHITEKYLVRECNFPSGTYLITKNPKHSIACIAYSDTQKWATIYSIQTNPKKRNMGYCQDLLKSLRNDFEKAGYRFGSTVALNPIMKHVLEKLEIKEYS